MIDPANTAMSNGAEDVWLAGPPADFLIGHKIKPVHLLNGPEGVGLKAMDAVGKGLTE